MATPRLLRPANQCLPRLPRRTYSTPSTTTSTSTSPFAPRHLLSIADLTPPELTTLLRTATTHKTAFKAGTPPPHLPHALLGRTIAILMSKRSTRTRVSAESAIAALGGHPLFLGAGDIQMGVNESVHDTSVVISSMVSGILARVNAHAEVAELAKWSSAPVINGLSDAAHPLQALADFMTMAEVFGGGRGAGGGEGLGLEGLKVAWVGDANNVLFDMLIAAGKLGVEVSVATPEGYGMPAEIRGWVEGATGGRKVVETHVPEEAVRGADVIVTDTWVSMGQEEEKKRRLKDFEGFQVTKELAQKGGAKEGWRFMHCLPRKPEEVSDEVFYSPASLVFQEAENRVWSCLAAIEAFVVNKGKI